MGSKGCLFIQNFENVKAIEEAVATLVLPDRQ
jgi:hypothetical protein